MPYTLTLHDDIEGKSLDLTFAEEALGLPAVHGFGYAMLKFGQKVGPNERFEVVRKLGWGRYSSVWLAKDHENTGSFVALKVLNGNATGLVKSGHLQELGVMQKLDPRLHDHCAPLLSRFELPGASPDEGDHICIVTEVYATDVDQIWKAIPTRQMPIPLAKKILQDVLYGLSQLHSLGIVYTDLKSANILCRSPLLTTSDAISFLLRSHPSELNPPEESYIGTVQSAKSQPITSNISPDEALRCSYVLGDLGHAQMLDQPTVYLIAAESYRPPEVILGGPWDKSVDLWMFGCLVFEFIFGKPLFIRSHPDHPQVPPDAYHIGLMVKILGQVFPVHLIKHYQYAEKWLDMNTGNLLGNPPQSHDFLPYLFRDLGSKRGLQQHDMEGALDLVLRCVRLNPEERPTAAGLLDNTTWLRE